jgi:hypothetical protein
MISTDGELACVVLSDGSNAAVDSNGNAVLSSDGYISFACDRISGECYIAVETGSYRPATYMTGAGTCWSPAQHIKTP